jgi:hypothetical protein
VVNSAPRGRHVAILGANSPAWVLSAWVTPTLGASSVAMNGWWHGELGFGVVFARVALIAREHARTT